MDWHLNWLKTQSQGRTAFYKAFVIGALLISFCLSSNFVFAEPAVSFSKTQIKVGARVITVELAKTEQQLARGLMFRKSLPPDEGMLFIFPETRTLSFWMKNTFIPLSIGFFGEDKKLIEVIDMKPSTSIMQTNHPSYMSSKPARYALEMNQGWFKKNGIKPGALLTISK